MRRYLFSMLSRCVIIIYPLIVYLSVKYDVVTWLLAIIGAGLLHRVLSNFKESQWLRGLFWLSLLGLLMCMSYFSATVLVMLLPSIIYVVWLYLFASTLQTSMPLVERFARLQTPQLSEQLVDYCYKVTLVWSIYFITQIFITLSIVLFFSHEVWLIYNGIVAYGLTASLFMAEYFYRKWRYKDTVFPSIRESFKNTKDISLLFFN